ncbi:MAG: V-type ATP synthase subunit D [Candidatus Omnitrophica bacterium]|nr:V-type ATP synthase subunit D [Candidatus Omnitrophota bacterium]
MKLKVNPTRMELLKLRKRARLAKRGHKLLKDKEEQLLIEFRALVGEVKKSRKAVEKDMAAFYMEMLKLKGILDGNSWKNYIESAFFKTAFSVHTRRIFNIPVSEVSFHTKPEKIPPDYTMSPYHYLLMRNGKRMIQHLLKLSFLENKLISFAYEIERTRRRVNALEYVLMPNLEETIKFIAFKLNENERSSLVMLKHIQLTRQ